MINDPLVVVLAASIVLLIQRQSSILLNISPRSHLTYSSETLSDKQDNISD